MALRLAASEPRGPLRAARMWARMVTAGLHNTPADWPRLETGSDPGAGADACTQGEPRAPND